MFKSLTYNRYDPKTKQYISELEDSDFGIVEVEIAVGVEVGVGVGFAVAVAREYSKRYEDVAEHSYAKAPIAEHSYAKAPIAEHSYAKASYAYVGKNLAAAVMWYGEQYKYSIEDTCKMQDKYCPKYIPNWKQYASSRNEHLEKILLLR